jgi:hypothetical protein
MIGLIDTAARLPPLPAREENTNHMTTPRPHSAQHLSLRHAHPRHPASLRNKAKQEGRNGKASQDSWHQSHIYGVLPHQLDAQKYLRYLRASEPTCAHSRHTYIHTIQTIEHQPRRVRQAAQSHACTPHLVSSAIPKCNGQLRRRQIVCARCPKIREDSLV